MSRPSYVATLAAAVFCISSHAIPAVASGSDAIDPCPSIEPASGAEADPHADFARLIDTYVRADGVGYAAWHAAPDDVAALSAYVDRLESVDPSGLDADDTLAYWINLYNAATLELVLAHYPVDSIKDIGGMFRSPWNKKIVRVAGEKLSLNAIENEIIRVEFDDARIHFALNCASVGCPPLADAPYRGVDLDAQLDAATRRTVNEARWVDLSHDRPRLTKLFDWYREDFTRGAETVGTFLSRHLEIAVDPATFSDVTYLDYDWSLNEIALSPR